MSLPVVRLTRRYHFSASHRLHSAELSVAENARMYGKCNNPYGHGHDYVLSVSVRGEVHPETGSLIPLQALDELVEAEVIRLFHNRNMNLDVPQFRHLVPTTENVASVIAELLAGAWPKAFGKAGVFLDRIHIQETDRNSFEIVVTQARELEAKAKLTEVHA